MNRKISVQLQDVSRKTWQFSGLRELLEFAQTECDNWKAQTEGIGGNLHPYINGYSHLTNVVNTINGWKLNLETWSDQQFDQNMQQLVSNFIRHLPGVWLWSSHPYTNGFVKLQRDFGKDGAASFIDFIIGNKVTNLNNP